MDKKTNSKKKRNIIILASVGVLVIACVLLVVLKPEKKLEVDTVSALKQTINETLDTTGTVSPQSESDFSLVDGAKVMNVNVKVGDIVQPGDVIATFDTSSLESALNDKETTFEKAQSAYNTALKSSNEAKTKIVSVKKQIADIEKQIAQLEEKSKTTTTSNKTTTTKKTESVKVSDSLVNRFVKLAKLFGVEYSTAEAKNVLTNILSSGSSVKDLSSMMDSLGTIANTSGSFDMSSFASMSGSYGSSMSLQTTLIQLKAQLATLELQSGSTYLSTYKTIADKARESYSKSQSEVQKMKDGWKAESKGIVSEVNIASGQTAVNSQKSDIDISSIISAVSSGNDVSSMISSFFDTNKTAIKVLYYPLIADLQLNKYDVLNVNLNQDVSIKSASGTVFDGKVSYISAVANSSQGSLNIGSLVGGSSSSSIPAQVTINNADKSVIVGVDVDVSIITDTAQNAIVVPVEAVCIDNGEVYVYVYDEKDSKAVKKDVKLGISNDTYYQVISGVNEGDVLIKNKTGLKDGVKVSVK